MPNGWRFQKKDFSINIHVSTIIMAWIYFLRCVHVHFWFRVLLFVPVNLSVVSCPDPGNPDHGVKLGSTYTYGSAVSYQCLAGYTISGAARIECQASQQWTADLPSCNGKIPPQRLLLLYIGLRFRPNDYVCSISINKTDVLQELAN